MLMNNLLNEGFLCGRSHPCPPERDPFTCRTTGIACIRTSPGNPFLGKSSSVPVFSVKFVVEHFWTLP